MPCIGGPSPTHAIEYDQIGSRISHPGLLIPLILLHQVIHKLSKCPDMSPSAQSPLWELVLTHAAREDHKRLSVGNGEVNNEVRGLVRMHPNHQRTPLKQVWRREGGKNRQSASPGPESAAGRKDNLCEQDSSRRFGQRTRRSGQEEAVLTSPSPFLGSLSPLSVSGRVPKTNSCHQRVRIDSVSPKVVWKKRSPKPEVQSHVGGDEKEEQGWIQPGQ